MIRIIYIVGILLLVGCQPDEHLVRPGGEVTLEVAMAVTDTWFGNPKWSLRDISVTPLPASSDEGETISWAVEDVSYVHSNRAIHVETEKSDDGRVRPHPVKIKFWLVGDDRLLSQTLSFRFQGTLLTGSPEGKVTSKPISGLYTFEVSSVEEVRTYDSRWLSRLLTNPLLYVGLFILALAVLAFVGEKKLVVAFLDGATNLFAGFMYWIISGVALFVLILLVRSCQ